MKIGVLTSGGDAPGMNACLANIAEECERLGYELVAFIGGYKGLMDNDTIKLGRKAVQNISHLGGSIIKSMRCPEFKTPQGVAKGIKTLKENKIDCLIAIGGDGTFNGLRELAAKDIHVIGIPATIDNDLFYLDKTLGFDTAVNTVTEAIVKIKETMLSMNRGCFLEVMGRFCGDIALYSGVASKANVIMLPERPLTFEQVLAKVKKCVKQGEESPMIVVSENLINIYDWARRLQEETGIEFKANVLGYLQRGGRPTVYDRLIALQFGIGAVHMAAVNKTSCALGVINDKIVPVSFGVALSAPSDFNFDLLKLVDF
ncbi:MAG: ATP-dependent 6-phosphofructokinase [Clostridia bacterium]